MGRRRAYDADDLETWLERAPSVHYWISKQLDRQPRDVATPDAWWERWSRRTRLVLPRGFLLAGRDATVSQVRDALNQPPQPTTVAAASREEALAVVCASLVGDSNDVDDIDDLRARALVVSGPGAWERLVDSGHGLVLIPTFDDADLSSAVSKGHHVVVPVGREVRRRAGDIEVPLLDRQAATEILVAEPVAIERGDADRYAAHARRNLLSLRRTLAINRTFAKPSWSQGAEGRRLVPLVLAGSWSEDVAGGRKAIEALTGRTYADVEGDLAVWSTMEDTPLLRTGSAWRVVSKEDAWDLVSPLIAPTDLTRFHEVAPRVLDELDPALDVPLERRFMAAVVGKPRTRSPRLRQGIADTTAFLGGYATDEVLRDRLTGKLHARRVVAAVTDNANADATGRAWQSLTDVLPLLAEASPDTFLDAVDPDLRRDEPLLRSLFLDSQLATFGTSSLHFYLMWALESLAWCSDHMSAAAHALARLARSSAAMPARIEVDGLEWVIRQLQRWPDGESVPQQAGLLLAVPRPTIALVDIVDELRVDVRASFWERMIPMRSDPEARPLVVLHLIEHGRAWAALGVHVLMLPSSGTTGPALDVDLVETALVSAATGSSVDAHHAASLSWEVRELLDYLERSGSDLQTRARLEFLFTNLLQHIRPARALDEALRTDPALFAEILSYVYWGKDEPRDQEVPPERKVVAEVGFSVIRSWHTAPGVRADGTVDVDALRAWVTEARRLLDESGRTVPGDISIGGILAYVPPDSDGLWPAEPVRDLIEDLRSEHIETGLRTAKLNSRGMVWSSPTVGGVQERDLAAQFRVWAERASDGWRRTATLLRQLADHYDEWARREDDRSEDFGDQGP